MAFGELARALDLSQQAALLSSLELKGHLPAHLIARAEALTLAGKCANFNTKLFSCYLSCIAAFVGVIHMSERECHFSVAMPRMGRGTWAAARIAILSRRTRMCMYPCV